MAHHKLELWSDCFKCQWRKLKYIYGRKTYENLKMKWWGSFDLLKVFQGLTQGCTESENVNTVNVPQLWNCHDFIWFLHQLDVCVLGLGKKCVGYFRRYSTTNDPIVTGSFCQVGRCACFHFLPEVTTSIEMQRCATWLFIYLFKCLIALFVVFVPYHVWFNCASEHEAELPFN